MKRSQLITLGISAACGTLIGFVDSRATWDDAGVTAAVLFVTALILAAMQRRAAWIIGFAVGVPVVGFNVVLHGGFGSVLAIGFSLIGAGAGYCLGQLFGIGGPARGT
jgi:hypothetical protein